MFGFRTSRRQHSRIAQAAVVATLFLPMLAPAVASAAGKKSAAKCDAVTGWSAVSGRPTNLNRLGVGGFYVWNEKGVWRLSVTHGDRRLQKFQGTVSFDAPIATRPVGAEGTFGDVVQSNGSTATFTFSNYGGVDGVAIIAPCANTVTVSGTIDGQPVTVGQLFLGSAGTNPPVVPVVLTKSSSSPVAASPAPAVPTTAAASVTKDCANPLWAPGLQGRPAALKGNGRNAATGMYLWAEKSTLRAVVVGDTGRSVQVDGTMTANADVRVTPVGLDGRKDSLKAEGNVVTFSFKTGVGLDGLDLVAPCATQLVIEATIDDGPITLFIGPGAAAVPAMPYLLTR
jgi:hypothetical protein